MAITAIEYEIRPFKNNLAVVLIIITLSLLAGFRSPDVARDYGQYQFAFDNIYDFVQDPSGAYFSVFEPGFVGVSLLFRLLLTHNYGLGVMIFFALVSLTLKFISIIKLSINPYLVILIYYSHYFILHEMTQIRIGLASAIFLFSLLYFLKKNFKAYVALILLATLFHYSAILYLLLIPFSSKHFNKYIYSGVILCSIGLGIAKISFFGYFTSFFISGNAYGKASTYAEVISYGVTQQINFFNLINIIKILGTLYLIYSVPNQHFHTDSKLTLFLKFNIFSLFIFSLFAGEPFFAFRIGELFGIVSIFTFAYLAKYLPFEKFNIFFVVLLALVFFYLNIYKEDLLKPYEIIKIM